MAMGRSEFKRRGSVTFLLFCLSINFAILFYRICNNSLEVNRLKKVFIVKTNAFLKCKSDIVVDKIEQRVYSELFLMQSRKS